MRAFFALPEADRLALDNVGSPHFAATPAPATNAPPAPATGATSSTSAPNAPPGSPAPASPRTGGSRAPTSGRPPSPNCAPPPSPGSTSSARSPTACCANSSPPSAPRPTSTTRSSAPHAHPHLKLVRYPGSAGDGTDQGVGAHKDYGFLTLLLQDTVGGLQVQREDGRFDDVPPLDGAFVVNLGELLEVATNGYLLATNHRVVSPPGATERFSVPFFYNPRLDAKVAPLPLPPRVEGPRHHRRPDEPPVRRVRLQRTEGQAEGPTRWWRSGTTGTCSRPHEKRARRAALPGARGCIDMRLRRVGATSHNAPAVTRAPEPPPLSGRCPHTPRCPRAAAAPAPHTAQKAAPAAPSASAPGCAPTTPPYGHT